MVAKQSSTAKMTPKNSSSRRQSRRLQNALRATAKLPVVSRPSRKPSPTARRAAVKKKKATANVPSGCHTSARRSALSELPAATRKFLLDHVSKTNKILLSQTKDALVRCGIAVKNSRGAFRLVPDHTVVVAAAAAASGERRIVIPWAPGNAVDIAAKSAAPALAAARCPLGDCVVRDVTVCVSEAGKTVVSPNALWIVRDSSGARWAVFVRDKNRELADAALQAEVIAPILDVMARDEKYQQQKALEAAGVQQQSE